MTVTGTVLFQFLMKMCVQTASILGNESWSLFCRWIILTNDAELCWYLCCLSELAVETIELRWFLGHHDGKPEAGSQAHGVFIVAMTTVVVVELGWSYEYRKISCISHIKSQNINVSRLVLLLYIAQSIETRYWVANGDVVGAAPTGDAPTISEWSTILLPTKVRLILEVWQYLSIHSEVTWASWRPASLAVRSTAWSV